MSLIKEVLMTQDLRRHFPRNPEQVKPVKRVPTIMNKKKPNKTYTRELLKVNEKMPNKFIAREKPPLDSKFVPFVNENFSNKKYNKKRRMKKNEIEALEVRKLEWICKHCGQSTFDVDYDYLCAQDEHLECALIHESKSEQKKAK